MINLSGGSESKAQMVAPCGAVSARVSVTLLVTPCSWRLLGAPVVCSVPVEFTVSGLLQHRSCFFKCPCSGSVPEEVPGLGLVLQRLWRAQTCRGSGSSLLPQRSQTHAQTGRGLWFLPTPSEVPDSCLDPQRSLVPAYSLRGPRLMPRPT